MQPQTKKSIIIPIITILLLFICTSISIHADEPLNLTWDATINITETTGKTDYIYIGEAPDAYDGPPADTYDMPKAPTSPPPYLRILANDNLPTPYTQLLGDYRHYPDSHKQWNLTILWYPSNPTDPPTNVTITWESTEIAQSEYTTIELQNTNNIPLTNMLQTTTYTFTCPPLIPQHYKITCTGTNHPPTTPTTPNGTTTGYHNIPYAYTTTSTDPENDPISYQYNWDDGTPPQWTSPFPSGQPCTQTHQWNKPGTYNLTIKARDSHNTETTWSSPQTITMLNHPPNTPTNPNPSNNSTQITTTQTLQWTCTDQDNDPLTYDIYFGNTTNPQKIITQQATTTFKPTLLPETQYYWYIIANDDYNGKTTSPLWTFTTKETTSPSGGGGPPPINIPPLANASLSDIQGFVKSQINFNGSLSTDEDGYITNWEWNFDDGHTGTGEKTTHTYTEKGTYHVTLTVTDNADSIAQDTIFVTIITANTPPDSPNIQGEKNGTINTNIIFNIISNDIDNDTLYLEIDWGDTTNQTEIIHHPYSVTQITHSWINAGVYNIQLRLYDSFTWSSINEFTIYINTIYFPNFGYILDTNNDTIYDIFMSLNQTEEIELNPLTISEYGVDLDNDGIIDYVLNIHTSEVSSSSPQQESEENIWILPLIIGVVVLIIIIVLFMFFKKK